MAECLKERLAVSRRARMELLKSQLEQVKASVLSNAGDEITISLGQERAVIRFVESHLQDLQTVISD